MELIFVLTVVFRKVRFVNILQVMQVERTPGVHAFVDHEMLTVFLMDKGMGTVRTRESQNFANVMVMVNAERFGLSTMHQLRGRVGRGDKQAYCVLVSDKPNNRIQVMCKTDYGFAIAKADQRERKSGELTGVKQSGRNKIVDEMIENPRICMHATYIVSKMTKQELLKHTEKYRAMYEQDKAGEDGL